MTQEPQCVVHNTSPLGLSLTHVVHQLSLVSPWTVKEGKDVSFLFSLTKHYVIRHPSEIFQFLLIVVGPSFFQLSGFVIVNHGSGIETVQKPFFRCTKGANVRLTSKLIRKQRCEQNGVLRTNQKCRPLYILLLPSLRDQQWV